MTRPLVESPNSLSSSASVWWAGWGGEVGPEENRKEEPTEGKDEIESSEGLPGSDWNALWGVEGRKGE